jgi:hypothetical protein
MRRPEPRRSLLQGLAVGLALWLAVGWKVAVAQGIDLVSLQLKRQDGELVLEFAARPMLSRAVEDALQRGVPVYFVAEATLLRTRWYWRDQRIARVQRSWRIAYQPLTSTWRVSLGALSQTVGSMSEALAVAGASGRWKVAELSQLDPDNRYVVDFSYQLDTSQLPSPMQIGLPGPSDWVLRVERRLPVE